MFEYFNLQPNTDTPLKINLTHWILKGFETYSHTASLCLSSEAELLLLEERELWPAEEGWLTFDLTATTNLWLDNPQHNLGLHLVLEGSRGESPANMRKKSFARKNALALSGKKKTPKRFKRSLNRAVRGKPPNIQ